MRNRLHLSQARTIDWTLARLGLSSPVLLVSGFLRSGTTWVQECLAESLSAKTVFEPLSPLEPRRRAMLQRDFFGRYDAMHGMIPGPWPTKDQTWRLLTSACEGGNSSRFSMACRQSRRESTSRRIVIKDVRLQFNLQAFHLRYGVPVLHVTRHPCAVAASLMRAEWGWSYSKVSLEDALPHAAAVWDGQTAGRDEVIARCDQDNVSRIAALWAVTERFVFRSLKDKSWAKRTAYERLAAAPDEAFEEVLAWIGIPPSGRPDFSRLSASCHPGTASTQTGSAKPAWHDVLSAADAARIMKIVQWLHPDRTEQPDLISA